MVEDLDPQVKLISKTNSPLSFNVIFSITNLPPNQMFRFWTFFPNGEPIGSMGFSSNDKGNASNAQGINEIISGFSSSDILSNGSYIFGKTLGTFTFDKKYDFHDWNTLHISKWYINIDLSFQRKTILTLNKIGNIPWGSNADVSGRLWFKDVDIEKESQVMPNGADWLIGRRIYFTGTNQFPASTQTDAFSKFLTKFRADNSPEQNCTLQAHYNGDSKYFDECDSTLVYYNIIKHRTVLPVKLDNLKLNPFNKDILRNKITLQANDFFRIKGKLIDIDFNIGIENQKINFKTNLPTQIITIPTDKDGSLQIEDLKVPSEIGHYYIKSMFSATDLYEKVESNVLEFDVIEGKLHNNKLVFLSDDEKNHKSSKKVFLSYSKEDIEQANRIYDYLVKSDVDVWFDKESLLPGQKWEIEIEKQIRKRDFVILLLSSNSVKKRGYFQKEYKLTLEVLDTIPEGQIYAIPLKLDECEIPHEFKKYHVTDLFPNFTEKIDKIINKILQV